jgi:hypothetical protein
MARDDKESLERRKARYVTPGPLKALEEKERGEHAVAGRAREIKAEERVEKTLVRGTATMGPDSIDVNITIPTKLVTPDISRARTKAEQMRIAALGEEAYGKKESKATYEALVRKKEKKAPVAMNKD